jgi:probable HAF family extracellular repeat protein
MLSKLFIMIAIVGALVEVSDVGTAASFTGLGIPAGASSSGATAISDDGTIVVGMVPYSIQGASASVGSEVFRWSASSGMEVIGDLPGGALYGRNPTVSNNGVIAATGTMDGFNQIAARWTESTGWHPLSGPEGIGSDANDISADGSVIVGTFYGSRGQQAFRWTEATGMKFLEGLLGEHQAGAVSADGNTIVGGASGSFRWTAATGMVGLGHFPGDTFSRAAGISANGLVIIGEYSFLSNNGERKGFRWTQETGLVPIPPAPGIPSPSGDFRPTGISGDGSVILGGGLIWDAVNGTRMLEEVFFHELGLAHDLAGWSGLQANGISADGRVIVGSGINPDGKREGWVVDLDQTERSTRPPGNFNGNYAVDAADYVTWRNGLGSTHKQTDYDVWKSNFGNQQTRGIFGTRVRSVELSATNELQSFVAGGRKYTRGDLVQSTLVEFAATSEQNTGGNIVVPAGAAIPAAGSRAALLTSDFRVDTGIVSPAPGSAAATLQFSPPLVNGPGPDLIVFEIGENTAPPGMAFQLTVDGTTGAVFDRAWSPTSFVPNVDFYRRLAGVPTDISQLENGNYSKNFQWDDSPLLALAIDLDELGVSPLTEISNIQFGTLPGRPYLDPVLFMGIRSVPALPGDSNSDGTVDAADYVVWRNGLGTTYTQADFDVWRAHFGQTAGSAGATAGLASSANPPVPEPTTAAVALFALAWLPCLSRAHHAGLPGWKPVGKPERALPNSRSPTSAWRAVYI